MQEVKLVVAKEDIVKYQFDKRTPEEQQQIAKMGGIASGKARNYKKEQLDNLKMLLDSEYKDGITYRQAMNLGVLKGALDGKAENFKTILDYIDDSGSVNGTPIVQINVIDNSNLEKVLYDEKDKS